MEVANSVIDYSRKAYGKKIKAENSEKYQSDNTIVKIIPKIKEVTDTSDKLIELSIN